MSSVCSNGRMRIDRVAAKLWSLVELFCGVNETFESLSPVTSVDSYCISCDLREYIIGMSSVFQWSHADRLGRCEVRLFCCVNEIFDLFARNFRRLILHTLRPSRIHHWHASECSDGRIGIDRVDVVFWWLVDLFCCVTNHTLDSASYVTYVDPFGRLCDLAKYIRVMSSDCSYGRKMIDSVDKKLWVVKSLCRIKWTIERYRMRTFVDRFGMTCDLIESINWHTFSGSAWLQDNW